MTGLFVTESAVERHRDLIDQALAQDLQPRLLSESDLKALTETVTPQGILAVCRTVDVSLDEVVGNQPQLLVCCAQVRDPGNAGTVIRCADAFGADGVILSEGSVDAYNAKTVRASVGSLFHLPLAQSVDLAAAVEACRTRGMQLLAADGAGTTDLDELTLAGELERPTLWLLGNEAWGLPPEQAALADRVVRVPLYGSAESLNLATAAAVCLYATASAQRTPRRPIPPTRH